MMSCCPSRISRIGKPVLVSALGTFLLLFAQAHAQDRNELRYLVFEPVLIETAGSEEELRVTELGSLPQSGDAITASAFIEKNARERVFPAPTDFEDSIVDYEKRIRDLELDGGAYEPALSQELLSLGTLYQAQGDHETALEYLDKALHINRVNLGLYNLEQEKIIEEKIESHVATGDLKAADTQQEYLFFLKRKAYGNASVELLPALSSYAEWNIFAFDSRLSMDPTLTYAAESRVYTENSVNNSIGEEDFRTVRLINAQNIYRTIIQILLNNYGMSDPRILDMEKKLALTNYFFATNLDAKLSAYNGNASGLTMMTSTQDYYDMTRISSNSMGYRHGRQALERRLEYMVNMEDVDPLEIARARVELGDWLLIFKKRVAALDTYEEAYEELQSTGVSQDTLDEIFSPAFPDVIPEFIDYRYTRGAWNIPEDQALEYQGWIDMRFRLNRFGQPLDVEVIGMSPNTTDPIETRLYRQLRGSTSFRPRFRDGSLLEEDIVEARYYYSY